MIECIHCGLMVPDDALDHWRECPVHPAREALAAAVARAERAEASAANAESDLAAAVGEARWRAEDAEAETARLEDRAERAEAAASAWKERAERAEATLRDCALGTPDCEGCDAYHRMAALARERGDALRALADRGVAVAAGELAECQADRRDLRAALDRADAEAAAWKERCERAEATAARRTKERDRARARVTAAWAATAWGWPSDMLAAIADEPGE